MMIEERYKRIHSADDPRIAAFRDIRERDLRRNKGQFIAEGTVVLRLLADAHAMGHSFRAEALLILENRLDGVSEIVASLPDDVAVYLASRDIMNSIVGFDIHRGVLALGHRRVEPTLEGALAALPEHALVVAAVGISNHDNIGALFRNAAAFRADLVLLDETCCDPLYRKALRVSVGAALKVPFVHAESVKDILSALQSRGFSIWGLSPRGQIDLRQIRAEPKMALLTGTEGDGLPAHIMERIRTARIPQASDLDSLNAGTATGIALYQIANAMKRI